MSAASSSDGIYEIEDDEPYNMEENEDGDDDEIKQIYKRHFTTDKRNVQTLSETGNNGLPFELFTKILSDPKPLGDINDQSSVLGTFDELSKLDKITIQSEINDVRSKTIPKVELRLRHEEEALMRPPFYDENPCKNDRNCVGLSLGSEFGSNDLGFILVAWPNNSTISSFIMNDPNNAWMNDLMNLCVLCSRKFVTTKILKNGLNDGIKDVQTLVIPFCNQIAEGEYAPENCFKISHPQLYGSIIFPVVAYGSLDYRIIEETDDLGLKRRRVKQDKLKRPQFLFRDGQMFQK